MHVQNPINAQAPTPDQFVHVKDNLSAADEAEQANVIRNPNATMTKVLEGLKDPGGSGAAAVPSSARELALAKLEAAIRERKVAKGKTAAHQTKTSGALPTQDCWLLPPHIATSLVRVRSSLRTSGPCLTPCKLHPYK